MSNEINGLSTRGELASAIAEFIQDLSAERESMIKVDLDRLYRDALRRYPWPQLFRWVDATVSVNTGGAYFFTPKDVRVILRVCNINTPYVIPEATLQDFVDMSAGFSNLSGMPYQYAQAGVSGINQVLQPATALEILSDSTDVRTGYIRGNLSGEARTATFTLTGITPVALGNWDEVYEIALASTSNSATVTVRTVTGSATVATVAPREVKSSYNRYRMAAIPQVQTALRVVYKFTPPMIMDDSHEYIVPIQDYLFESAVACSLEGRRQQVSAQQHLAKAEAILQRIWDESRGMRQEQYVPASPYWGFNGDGIYVGALGVGGIF